MYLYLLNILTLHCLFYNCLTPRHSHYTRSKYSFSDSDHCNAYAWLSDNIWLLKMTVFPFFVWKKIKYFGVIRYLRVRSAKNTSKKLIDSIQLVRQFFWRSLTLSTMQNLFPSLNQFVCVGKTNTVHIIHVYKVMSCVKIIRLFRWKSIFF